METKESIVEKPKYVPEIERERGRGIGRGGGRGVRSNTPTILGNLLTAEVSYPGKSLFQTKNNTRVTRKNCHAQSKLK